jgi:hypothetical protein
MPDEHLMVDEARWAAWAGRQNFRPKDRGGGNDTNRNGGRNPTGDFNGLIVAALAMTTAGRVVPR